MIPDPFRSERGAVLMLVLTNLIWGGNYVASKVFVSESPPFTAAFVRFLFATALILLIYASLPGARLPRREEWSRLAAVGFAFFLYNLFFYSGLKATTSANAALLAATSPAITAVLSAVMEKDRLSRVQALGLLISFVGVSLVVLKELPLLGAGAAGATGLRLNPGDFLVVCASACWSFYSIYGKRAMQTMPPLAVTSYAWVLGTLMLFPAAWLEAHVHPWFAFSGKAWLSLSYVVVLSSVASFTWWYQGIQAVGPNRASVFLNLIPLAGLVLAVVMMKEAIVAGQVVGAILILSGVYLVAHKPATSGFKAAA